MVAIFFLILFDRFIIGEFDIFLGLPTWLLFTALLASALGAISSTHAFAKIQEAKSIEADVDGILTFEVTAQFIGAIVAFASAIVYRTDSLAGTALCLFAIVSLAIPLKRVRMGHFTSKSPPS